jgi:hypothetical protein
MTADQIRQSCALRETITFLCLLASKRVLVLYEPHPGNRLHTSLRTSSPKAISPITIHSPKSAPGTGDGIVAECDEYGGTIFLRWESIRNVTPCGGVDSFSFPAIKPDDDEQPTSPFPRLHLVRDEPITQPAVR